MSELAYTDMIEASGLADHTKESYLFAVRQFCEKYTELTPENLRDYKLWLIENYKPATVNLRIQAINWYLKRIEQEKLTLRSVKVQQKPFLENVISEADYEFLKKQLLRDGDKYWYYVVRFMGATGARVSELVKIKAEHVIAGYFDILSKGGKVRRLYIPQSLKLSALEWLTEINRDSGFLFVNRWGEPCTVEHIRNHLKLLARRYHLDPKCMHPHSFRHRFAKNFLAKCPDISFLADLMGHESIETTRIYLRKTSTEQRELVDTLIDW